VLFPDGTSGAVPLSATRDAGLPVRTVRLKDSALLFNKPNGAALVMRPLAPAAVVTVFGSFNEYALVQTATDERGWVFEKVLN
jgi:hypothetical protein